MRFDNMPRTCTGCLCGKEVFVILDLENVASDQTRHSDPIEQTEYHKDRNHVGTQQLDDRIAFIQRLVENNRQQDNDQDIGK